VDFKGAWDGYDSVAFTSVKLQLDSGATANDQPSTDDVSIDTTETKAAAPAAAPASKTKATKTKLTKTKRLYGWVQAQLKGYPTRKRGRAFLVDLISGSVSVATVDRPGANCTSTTCVGKVADISIMRPAPSPAPSPAPTPAPTPGRPAATNMAPNTKADTAASVVTAYLSYGTGTGTNIVADIGIFAASWDLSASSLSGKKRRKSESESRPTSEPAVTAMSTLDLDEYMLKTTPILRPFSISDMTYDFAGESVLFAGGKLDGTLSTNSSAMWVMEAGLDGNNKRTVDIPFPSVLPESLKTHSTNGIEVVPTSPRQLYLNFGSRAINSDLWTARGIETTAPHAPTLLIPNLLPASGGGSISLQWEESQQLMHWFANGRVVTASFKTGGGKSSSSSSSSSRSGTNSSTNTNISDTTSVSSLDYTWVPGPAYISTFVTTGIYTVLGFINGSVTLNTKNADTHSFHCLEMSSNETGWTPATMLVEDGKLYLGEKSGVYNPSVGRIRVAALPKQTAQHIVGARDQQQTKLLVFKPFIGNTSAIPFEMAVVPTRCLDAFQERRSTGY
jgi:hypothetical protein